MEMLTKMYFMGHTVIHDMLCHKYISVIHVPASGCGRLWVVDVQWKLMFAHCMMKRLVILLYFNVWGSV